MARPTYWTEARALALGQELIDWMLADESRIYWQRFWVIEKGLYKQIAFDLSKKYESFAELLKRAKDIQEIRLVEKEGKGEIKSLFMLKNHHGYADKMEVKSDNITRTMDSRDLAQATEQDLKDMLRSLTDSARTDNS